MLTYKDLLAQRIALEKQQAELDKQISLVKREERSEVIAKIRAMMEEHDLSIDDLGTGKPRGPKPGKTGKKVAPKYRDTATGQTWSGRGLQPKWLKSALATGRSLSDFAITV